jgi:hypothetical protein
VTIIGVTSVAAVLRSQGQHDLAELQGLTPSQALSALSYLSGFAPEKLRDALVFVGATELPSDRKEAL